MRTFIERVFHVRQEEQDKVLFLFLYAFCTAGAYITARSVADGVFLARLGPRWLPLMYILAAVCMIGVSLLYSNLARWARLDRVVRFTLLCLAGSSLLFPSVLSEVRPALPVLAALYVVAEIRGGLGTILFSSLLHEMFRHGDAQRVFGLAGAGATLAGVTLGGLVGYHAETFPVTSLLYVAAALEFAALFPLHGLKCALRPLHPRSLRRGEPWDPSQLQRRPGTRRRRGARRRAARSELRATLSAVLAQPLVRAIGVMVFLKVLVAFLVEYEWKYTATNYFDSMYSVRSEAELTQYFGLFYSVMCMAAGVMQLLVTGRLLFRFDLAVSLLVLPGALLLAMLGVIGTTTAAASLVAVTVAKGCDVFRRSINDPAMQLAYLPIPGGQRRQAVALVNGMVKPAAEALAGLAIIQMAWLGTDRWVPYAATVLIVVWIITIAASRRGWRLPLMTNPEGDIVEGGMP